MKHLTRQPRASINRLVQEELRRLAGQELAAQMRAAYERLVRDEETNVEPFLAAQRAAVNHDG